MEARNLSREAQPGTDVMPLRSHLIEGEFAARAIAQEAEALSLVPPALIEERQDVLTGQFRGWMWMKEIQPGLIGSACDLLTLTDVTLARPVDRSVRIEVLLHGEQGSHGSFAPEHGTALPNRIEHAQIVGLGEVQQCRRELHAGGRRCRVGITVQPRFLEHFSDVIPSPEIEMLHRLMGPGVHSIGLPRDELLVRLARTIADSPYAGSLDTLFRETAFVQVLCQTLSLLRDERRVMREIGSRHYDAVMRARELIDASLLSPPGTMELARDVGINRNALQAGFRAVFGTTVFGYVRDQRLKMARLLIEQHRLGAAEAGYRVGFKSASAFSAAYRKAYGHVPSSRMH